MRIRPRVRRPKEPDLERCTACGTYNDPELVASGGEFVTNYDATTYEDQVGQSLEGCRFCGCPAWRTGGKLGDMDQ